MGWFYSIGRGTFDANLLGGQVTGLVFVLALQTFWMFPFFTLMYEMDCLRIDALEEIAGLDAAYKSAQQEGDDKLKQDIREEFKKFKKDEIGKRSHRNHAGGASLASRDKSRDSRSQQSYDSSVQKHSVDGAKTTATSKSARSGKSGTSGSGSDMA